tara:strand:+ start:278 stop:610 length:333 start_codon:yes stop_codon:yes gene_type:complete
MQSRNISARPIIKDVNQKNEIVNALNNASSPDDVMKIQLVLKQKLDDFFGEKLSIDGKKGPMTSKYLKQYLFSHVDSDSNNVMEILNSFRENKENVKENKEIIQNLKDTY